jgi:predicted TIM-barrel fold metal-dependent hydrolase
MDQQGVDAMKTSVPSSAALALETTYFLSRLIFDGTLDKFPGLRVCAAHGGGYLYVLANFS